MIPRIFEHIARVVGHERNYFCNIERGAATEPDDRVCGMRFESGNAGNHLTSHGIAAHTGKNVYPEAAKRGSKFCEQGQSCNAFIGDDERPAAMLRLEIGGDFVPCPAAKMNVGWKRKSMDGHNG